MQMLTMQEEARIKREELRRIEEKELKLKHEAEQARREAEAREADRQQEAEQAEQVWKEDKELLLKQLRKTEASDETLHGIIGTGLGE